MARQQLAPVPAAGEEVHAALPQATHNKVPPCSVQAGREEYADATGQMPFRYRAEVASFFDLLRQVPGHPAGAAGEGALAAAEAERWWLRGRPPPLTRRAGSPQVITVRTPR